MSKTLEWAKEYVDQVESLKQHPGWTLEGSDISLYQLAQAIVVDQEGSSDE